MACESKNKALIFHQNVYSFLYFTCQTSFDNAFLKTHWGPLERIGTNKYFFEKVILPKIARSWLKFGFQLPKDIVLELINRPGVAGALL